MIRSSRTLSLLVGAFIVLTIVNLTGMALAPTLLTYHPLLLVALNPLDRHMVLVASVAPLAPYLAVAAARRTLSCALGYGFGRYYGEDGLHWVQTRYPRFGRFAAWLLRGVKRASPVLIVLAPSTGLAGLLGGAARVPFPLFLLFIGTGQLIWAWLAYRLSVVLADWLVPITIFMREHVVGATVACIVLVAIYSWRKRNDPSFTALPEEVPQAAIVEPEAPSEP